MEELASEEEAKTAGGAGEVGMVQRETEEESEGSGAENGPGGSAAGGGATLEATSKDVDTGGVGGRHGVKKRERYRVTGQQENPARESYGVV